MTHDPDPWLVTCVGVATDLPLLPHFLRHYHDLGVDPARMIVILNALDAGDAGLPAARALLRGAGTHDPVVWVAPYTSEAMWAERRAVQRRFCGSPEDWVLSADVDEYHDYPEPLPDLLTRAAALGATCIQGVFIDRLAKGGELAPVMDQPDILQQFPIRAEVGLSIGGRSAAHGRGGTVKIMAARGSILPGRGGHRPEPHPDLRYLYHYALGDFGQIENPGFRFGVPTRVHHIHWTDTLAQRLAARLSTPGVSPAGAEYGRRQLDHICANDGISLPDIAIDAKTDEEPWPLALARLRKQGRRLSLLGSMRAALRKVVGR